MEDALYFYYTEKSTQNNELEYNKTLKYSFNNLGIANIDQRIVSIIQDLWGDTSIIYKLPYLKESPTGLTRYFYGSPKESGASKELYCSINLYLKIKYMDIYSTYHEVYYTNKNGDSFYPIIEKNLSDDFTAMFDGIVKKRVNMNIVSNGAKPEINIFNDDPQFKETIMAFLRNIDKKYESVN